MTKTHISNENSKIGKIPNFSLPPIKSCPNCKYCFQKDKKLTCYALKAYQQYTVVRVAWDDNYTMATHKPKQLRSDIVKYLSKTRKKFFRLHVSGDFFSQSYLDMWIDICQSFPGIRFLAFTKAFGLDYSNIPANLKIIYSLMPGMPMPTKAGTRAYCGNLPTTNKKRVYYCPGNCEGCMMCWNLRIDEAVHFDIH